MKPIALGLIVLVASAVAYVPKSSGLYSSHPRPEYDTSSYLNGRLERSTSSEEQRGEPTTTSTSYFSSLRNMANKVSSALLDRVPNARQILSVSKDVLERKTANEVMRAINDVCNVATSINSIMPSFVPEKQQINMHLMTRDSETAVPLSQPQRLLDLPEFRQDHENVVYISGWKKGGSSRDDSPLNKLKEAYQCRGNVNFILIDLDRHMDSLQTLLSMDTEQIGQWVGEVLTKLAKRTYNTNRIHLIGHGIGAHIAGAAARKYTEMTGNMIPRITALDPVKLCYEEAETLSGLQKGDADFVDVIHTSAYGLGVQKPIGDVDFYPNGPSVLQPGSSDLIDAHNKAVEYFAETVMPGNERNFLGQKCNSMKKLHSTVCQQRQIPMGYATPIEAKGNYFLQTNSVTPYGNNAKSGSSRFQCLSGRSLSNY